MLYAMSGHKGWMIFENLANQVLKELDQINSQAILSGAPFEEIGRNTVVINLAKDIVTRLLQRVADARESCEPKP